MWIAHFSASGQLCCVCVHIFLTMINNFRVHLMNLLADCIIFSVSVINTHMLTTVINSLSWSQCGVLLGDMVSGRQ